MPKLAVIGQPISHSRSPAMHTAALKEMGLADEWSYVAIEMSPDEFHGGVRGLPAEGFAGVNVTVPHKVAALAIATSASSAAIQIGAANTLTFADGGIAAENTDAVGIINALRASPAGLRALVLGAGGSARAAIWALQDAGADVSIWNRTSEKAEALATELGATVVQVGDDGALPVADFDILLNATTIGLGTANPPPGRELGADPEYGPAEFKSLRVPADAISANQIVVDLAYGVAETPLAAAARAGGARVVDGLEVLVQQGAASLRLWTGIDPPMETMRTAARER